MKEMRKRERERGKKDIIRLNKEIKAKKYFIMLVRVRVANFCDLLSSTPARLHLEIAEGSQQTSLFTGEKRRNKGCAVIVPPIT